MKEGIVICLMGPTASGKTNIAIEIAKHLPCNIISVDSALVYCEMDIGTAKPSKKILQNTPHRLIDIRNPNEPYSAAQFVEDAEREIQNSFANHRIPLLVGGTMLYFHALQQGLSYLPAADSNVRSQLSQELQANGLNALHDRLSQIDPDAASRIHPNDSQRIQRALEVYEITGKTMTELCAEDVVPFSKYHFLNIVIAPSNRQILHQRIEQRFSAMLAQGFIEEVENLMQRRELTLETPSMRAVGYRQVWQYLTGKFTYSEMCERGMAATRQLAKRQLTWLRAWQEGVPFDSLDSNHLMKILRTIDTYKLNN